MCRIFNFYNSHVNLVSYQPIMLTVPVLMSLIGCKQLSFGAKNQLQDTSLRHQCIFSSVIENCTESPPFGVFLKIYSWIRNFNPLSQTCIKSSKCQNFLVLYAIYVNNFVNMILFRQECCVSVVQSLYILFWFQRNISTKNHKTTVYLNFHVFS